jgi:hypothetical protein
MVNAGNLDQPGVGFVYVTAVEQTVGLLHPEERERIEQEAVGGRRSFLRRR